MLNLQRLRLLRELAARGTIGAVAESLSYSPSAVSQQLSQLEREAGVPLLERAGRGVRLTDAALVLVGHAEALLERAARAEADLAAAAETVAGRARIAGFESVALHLALFVRRFEREVRAPFPPAPVVRALTAPLAALGRHRGHAGRYAPAPAAA